MHNILLLGCIVTKSKNLISFFSEVGPHLKSSVSTSQVLKVQASGLHNPTDQTVWFFKGFPSFGQLVGFLRVTASYSSGSLKLAK